MKDVKTKAEENREIERAIVFMVTALKESENQKPVILHSMRVFSVLDRLEYDTDILIASLLHDLIEDTTITESDIVSAFGKEVAALVKANTFDESIKDETERYKELFTRCREKGINALVIKASDLLDNIDYYEKTGPYEKVVYFLEISKEILKQEVVYKKLYEKYEYARYKELHEKYEHARLKILP